MSGHPRDETRAHFFLWVCPKGHYDADPILRRSYPFPCFQCGEEAVKAVNLSRVNSRYHIARLNEARGTAPLMKRLVVVPLAREEAEREHAERAEAALREIRREAKGHDCYGYCRRMYHIADDYFSAREPGKVS